MPGGAPAPLLDERSGRLLVFVDVESAKYEVTLRADGLASASSKLRIAVDQKGCPIIDLYARDLSAVRCRFDGNPVNMAEIDLPSVPTAFSFLDKELAPGSYTVEIEHEFVPRPHDTLCEQWPPALASDDFDLLFEMSDALESARDMTIGGRTRQRYKRRLFLERYLPANLEFDQHPVEIVLHLPEDGVERLVLHNGSALAPPTATTWQLGFPPEFNCSCPFLCVVKKDLVASGLEQFELRSADGRKVPVTLVSSPGSRSRYLYRHRRDAQRSFKELEARFGCFPFERLVVLSGKTAMEYAGAIQVSGGHTRHELFHNYVARCVMPVDGNTGWFDEAVAYWIESGSPLFEMPPSGGPCDLGAGSAYQRHTNPKAESVGRALVGHFAYLLKHANRAMDEFIAELVHRHKGRTLSSEEVRDEMKSYVGETGAGTITELFDRYVFNQPGPRVRGWQRLGRRGEQGWLSRT